MKKLGRNVVALGMVSLLTDLSAEMIYPLLPVFLATVLGASATTLGMIEGAAESTAGLLKFASGWWSDKTRRRKPLVLLGYGIATFVRPLVAVAQSASHVLAIRLTDRVGKGIRTSPRDALIADSVPAEMRGVAFGFHRSMDHLGAVIGPLVAFALLSFAGLELRTVFLLAAIPGVLSLLVLYFGVKERAPAQEAVAPTKAASPLGLGKRFYALMGVIFVFALGNSTDAFLLLRATEVGVPVAQIPILWALLHVVKSASSTPGGALSDRIGRKPVIIAGWIVFTAVYLGFSAVTEVWQVWALFVVYGVYFGLVEGTEKALVADFAHPSQRGSAFGAYNLTISAAALPASLIFGIIWDRVGAERAFQFGATLGVVAIVGLIAVLGTSRTPAAPA